jgi:hypothetical protein
MRRARPVARVAVVLGAVGAFGVVASVGLGAFGAEVEPPTPRISSGPPKSTASRAATFRIDAAPGGITLECSLDGSEFSRCARLTTYRRLALGGHTFRVRARPPQNQAGRSASYEWLIRPRPAFFLSPSRIVPRPVMTTMPTRPYRSPNATFRWRSLGPASWRPGTTFRCSLDGKRWKLCRTPITYSGLHSGRHVFRVRAHYDGRVSRQNRFTWTIELSLLGKPAITQVSGGSPSVDAAFEFEADNAAGYECRIDGGPWTPCSSPVELDDVAPGGHELCVRALSATGVPGLDSCLTWTQSDSSSPPPTAPPSPEWSFSISGDVVPLLTPGTGGQLPLVVSNPNAFDILVGQLVVTVEPGSSQPGCDGPANLSLTQSNAAGPGLEILVPANGSVTLPAQGATAPVVEMLDLSTNQDACKGAVFSLSYSGTARTP